MDTPDLDALKQDRAMLYARAHEAAAAIAAGEPYDYELISFNLGKLFMLASSIYEINHRIEGR